MFARQAFKSVMSGLFVLFTASAALAESPYSSMDQSAGEAEFMNSCAVCHGADATGSGSLAELMTVSVPNLTVLSQNNDGEFPMLAVIHIIDGRTGLRGHGSQMPFWGERFARQATATAGDYGAELVVRGRILALAQYLESIQK